MEMNLDNEVKKELYSVESWIIQISNIIYTIFWLIGWWLMLSAFLIGLACIVLVLTHDENGFTFTVFQTGFRSIVIYSSAISAILVFCVGFPKKIRNVFFEIASNRVNRYKSIKHEFESQMITTEGLLLEYNLITKDQIEKRKHKKLFQETYKS